eukprot:1136993-Pelagomonas_calceolata.AAC.9
MPNNFQQCSPIDSLWDKSVLLEIVQNGACYGLGQGRSGVQCTHLSYLQLRTRRASWTLLAAMGPGPGCNSAHVWQPGILGGAQYSGAQCCAPRQRPACRHTEVPGQGLCTSTVCKAAGSHMQPRASGAAQIHPWAPSRPLP